VLHGSSRGKKRMHLSLSLSSRSLPDAATGEASGPPRQRVGRTAAVFLPLASSLFPLPSPSPSLSITMRTGRQRLPQAGTAAVGALLLLLLSPSRLGPASGRLPLVRVCSCAAGAIGNLAACARGRGSSASTQLSAAVPFSDVDALASYNGSDYQVVVPPPTAWLTK
jgi:hypothetical protein